MRRYISCDEWYPVYTLEASEDFDDADCSEVPGELVARWEAALKEHRAIQDELMAIEFARPAIPQAPVESPKSVVTPEIKAKLNAMPMKEYTP